MAGGPSDPELREAARHRGYRLVKSRVKTPGKGDYGKYGLVDAKGAAVFGREKDGPLTTSAAEVAAFLREGSASTWAASVDTAPDAPVPKKRAASKTEEEVPLAIRPRRRARRVVEDKPAARTSRKKPVEDKPERPVKGRPREPKPEHEPAPVAEAKLRIRRATADDADAVADLVTLIPGDGDRNRVAALCSKRGADLLVADRDGVIGVVAWTLIPTLQRGTIGRISSIVVAEDARRAGLGRALLEAAVAAMAKASAVLVEAVSDIEIRNSHRFFRETGFEQTSYRFARPIGD